MHYIFKQPYIADCSVFCKAMTIICNGHDMGGSAWAERMTTYMCAPVDVGVFSSISNSTALSVKHV